MPKVLHISSLAIAALVLLLPSCKKENASGVPPVNLDISINVNNPAYVDLAVPGGWVYLTGGSQGLIVYRASPTEFVALDRHCTYQSTELCRVYVDSSEVIARDSTCCHSAFLINNGSVILGPASINLQQYNTSFNGTTLRIYN